MKSEVKTEIKKEVKVEVKKEGKGQVTRMPEIWTICTESVVGIMFKFLTLRVSPPANPATISLRAVWGRDVGQHIVKQGCQHW